MNENRIQILEKYIAEEPENPFNRYALAMEYYELLPDKSLELLASLIEDHSNYLPSYYKLAHLLWEAEEYDRAKVLFEQGIALAKEQKDEKAEKELKAAYQNFLFDVE